MKSYWLNMVSAAVMSFVWASSSAEDVDLFANIVPPDSGVPNVILVLDNSANWSTSIPIGDCFYNYNKEPTTEGPKASNPNKEQGTKMAIEKCALYNVLDALKNNPSLGKFNLAIMLYNEPKDNGAYPRNRFMLIDTSTAEGRKNIEDLQALIKSLTIGGDKGSNADWARVLYEAYLWYKGETPYNGALAPKKDAGAFETNGKYKRPASASCAGNHIILIANGAPQGNEDMVQPFLNALALTATPPQPSPVESYVYPTSEVQNADQNNWADEMARMISLQDVSTKDALQGIQVHGIAITGANGDGLYPNFIEKIALQGGGSYRTATDATNLATGITDLLSSLIAKDSVFASASLPVDITNQGTYLNRVYVGLFRPNADAKPRWVGNLKQYQFQLAANQENIYLADADGTAAIATVNNNGFIRNCARSFWTPTTSDTYWTFNPQGSCILVSGVNTKVSNSPDGDIVEKGGAAYRLRLLNPYTNRKVLTCTGTCAAGSQVAITSANSGLATDVVNWLKGMDNLPADPLDDDALATATPSGVKNMRPTVHGDVVHSRPVVIDYGVKDGAVGAVVFYGGNDGMLRAINGNQGDNDGGEYWSFVAPEHYGIFDRLRNNTPEVYYPSTPTGSATPKSYGFDGPVTTYVESTGTSPNQTVSKAMIYATMRRGGSSVYAFNVLDPANPILAWRRTLGTLPTGLPNVGQTWSSPKVLKASGYAASGVPKPLLIFGGGYDTCEDGTFKGSDLNTCPTTGAKGNKIYVVDAIDGTVLNSLSTDRSVVGDVTVVPNSVTGLAEYAYAADTGGNVYRVTIGTAVPGSWTIVKIASLGCATASCDGGTANRKFLFGPDVVPLPGYNLILLGSGDREHPLISNTTTVGVSNAFFALKDNRSVSPTLISLDQQVAYDDSLANFADDPGVKNNLVPALMKIDPNQAALTTAEQARVDSPTNRGWYLAFGTAAHAGEQVVTSAVAVYGVVTFSTHIPSQPKENSCGSGLGEACVYNVLYSNANSALALTPRCQPIAGGGLPPSPTSGLVTIEIPPLVPGDPPTTTTVPFIIGADPKSPLEGKIPKAPPSVTPFTSRSYYYRQK